MIAAERLTRRYGGFTAVSDVSFSVDEGEIVGILGPNGAGKTTTIRMLTGFLPPTSGRVTMAGRDIATEPKKARRELGYLPENVALYPEMRTREYLAYRAGLEGLRRRDARAAIGDVLERCLLRDVEHQIIGTLSKGYRQRVGLASAILHRPGVLILDEPTVGLDPKQIIAIRELIRELGEKRTLMVSTHILPEVEQLCHRVLIVDRGRIVAEGSPAELRARARSNTSLTVTVQNAPSGAENVLRSIEGVQTVTRADGNGQWHIECAEGRDLRAAVFETAVAQSWVLLELTENAASLEDVFVRLTTHDGDDSRAAAAPVSGDA